MLQVISRSYASKIYSAIVNHNGVELGRLVKNVKEDGIDFGEIRIMMAKGSQPETVAVEAVRSAESLMSQVMREVQNEGSSNVVANLYVEIVVRLIGAFTTHFAFEEQCKHINVSDKTSASSLLLKGLLFAFTPFLEAYLHKRAPRSFGGCPGWDTPVLLSFMQLFREAIESCQISCINLGVFSDLIRTWRKLLSSLQGIDPTVAIEKSRRRGALYVANCLICVFLLSKNIHQARVIVQSVESNERLATEEPESPGKAIVDASIETKSVVAEFRYYQGNMAFLGKNYSAAFNAFLEAYTLLPHSTSRVPERIRSNKLRAHVALLSASLMCMIHPPQKYLVSDPVSGTVLYPLFVALTNGSAAAFSIIIDIFSGCLQQRGLYFYFQEARLYCYLILVQRVQAAVTSLGGDGSMISLNLLVNALSAVNTRCCSSEHGIIMMLIRGETEGNVSAIQILGGEKALANAVKSAKQMRVEVGAELELDDVTLWIARLISKRLIMGYISYEHKILVLSKKNPFPTLTDSRTIRYFV